eukprot:75297-Chlamydomonas_euryale.AAC.6
MLLVAPVDGVECVSETAQVDSRHFRRTNWNMLFCNAMFCGGPKHCQGSRGDMPCGNRVSKTACEKACKQCH